ncbi:hypothetical protein IJG73_03100, partial [Candidatus Saccharibacteria bacterium]|nr:hypothetical protein [Candidatus Saccharibacteria bacterium]
MTTLADYRNERLKKLDEIKALGIDPFPATSYRDTKLSDVTDNFAKLKGQTVTVAGRIIAIRSFGKIAFIKIRDYFGETQLFMKEEAGEASAEEERFSIRHLNLLDVGDFVEATGTVDKTK